MHEIEPSMVFARLRGWTLQAAGRKRLCLTIAFALTLVCAPQAPAKPRLYTISPYTWQRGQEIEVSFRGEQLTGVHQLLDYQQGVTVHEWHVEEPKTATAKITVAADAQLGAHALRLCTSAGISDLRLVYVCDSPTVDEQEPNNAPEAAQSVARPTVVNGRLDGNHSDWFAIDAEANERVSLELFGIRLGRAMLDAELRVLDPDEQVVAESDDTLLTRQDPFVSFLAPATGTYKIRVGSAAGEGNPNYHYALHVGSFPRPVRVTPNGGAPGESVDVTWHLADGSSQQETIKLPLPADLPTHDRTVAHVTPADERGTAPSSVPLFLGRGTVTQEQEPNNTYPQATRLEIPAAVAATMNADKDRDCYIFAAKKGETLLVRVHAHRELRTKLDSVLAVRHGDGKFITSNDDFAAGPDSSLQFNAPADGDYLIVQRDHQNRGGVGFDYWLEVRRAAPKVTINLPDRNRNESITLAVPRGGRMALRVTATKEFIDGPVELQLPGLMDHLTAHKTVLAPGQPSTALLVSAAAEAPLAGQLLPLVGTLTTNDRAIEGHLRQRQLLVAARNNFYMYGYEDSRLAVAVVDTAPFDLRLVQPQAPLVRSGTKELRIEAIRAEGFNNPINVRLLDNPLGVSTRGQVTIPADQTQVTLTATANNKAALGKSQIVAIGSTTKDGIAYELASELIDLEVIEPFVAVKFPKAKVTRGQSAPLTVGLECKQEFLGEATAELVGLPAGVTAEPTTFAHGATELPFTISATDKARLGRAGGLVCRITIERDGEPIVHMLGTGQVRVDRPPVTDTGG